jgi:hypothetical protein
VNQAIQVARRNPEVKSLVLLSGETDRNGRRFLENASGLPIFVSVADDDGDSILTEMMEYLLGISANPGDKFAHYSTGGHGTAMFAPHPELPKMIVDWFVTTLIKTPGRAPANTFNGIPQDQVHTLELIDAGDTGKVEQMLSAARQRNPDAVIFPENIVNLLAYERLQARDAKAAIDMLKLNAEAFPNSPNVYDSLSDAYLADDQKDVAREYAKKALDKLTSDSTDSPQRKNAIKESAEKKLKELGDAPI